MTYIWRMSVAICKDEDLVKAFKDLRREMRGELRSVKVYVKYSSDKYHGIIEIRKDLKEDVQMWQTLRNLHWRPNF